MISCELLHCPLQGYVRICTRRHAKPLSVCPKALCAFSLLLSHRRTSCCRDHPHSAQKTLSLLPAQRQLQKVVPPSIALGLWSKLQILGQRCGFMRLSNSAEPREELRNHLGTMILQSCHPWLRYTFQPVTRDPASFSPRLEPASKLCSRSRSSVLGSSGLQCLLSDTQGFISMSLVEVMLFPVCRRSDMLPSFSPEVVAPSRCSV